MLPSHYAFRHYAMRYADASHLIFHSPSSSLFSLTTPSFATIISSFRRLAAQQIASAGTTREVRAARGAGARCGVRCCAACSVALCARYGGNAGAAAASVQAQRRGKDTGIAPKMWQKT